MAHLKPIVKFPGTTRTPNPSPALLETHYIIASILRVSGIGEMVDRLIRESDMDDDMINPNGSTDLASIISRQLLIGLQEIEY